MVHCALWLDGTAGWAATLHPCRSPTFPHGLLCVNRVCIGRVLCVMAWQAGGQCVGKGVSSQCVGKGVSVSTAPRFSGLTCTRPRVLPRKIDGALEGQPPKVYNLIGCIRYHIILLDVVVTRTAVGCDLLVYANI